MNDANMNHTHEKEQLDTIRKKVIQSIAQNIDLYGITPSIGRLYGTMYFQNKPMTLDEMRDALGMSKTSMSTGVRSLLDIKMVHKTWEKGVRKDLYKVEEDWYKTFTDLFSTKWGKATETNVNVIKQAKKDLMELADQTTDDDILQLSQQDLEKLNHALSYYKWLSELIESLETGRIFEFIPKPADPANPAD